LCPSYVCFGSFFAGDCFFAGCFFADDCFVGTEDPFLPAFAGSFAAEPGFAELGAAFAAAFAETGFPFGGVVLPPDVIGGDIAGNICASMSSSR
jgi:hypothetical protein